MQGILRPRLGIGTVSCPCILLVASQGPSGFGESGGRLSLAGAAAKSRCRGTDVDTGGEGVQLFLYTVYF